jgi:hypothetical protein
VIFTLEFPARRVICSRCDGKGTHVNPNIDGNGITGEEMSELGPDFFEDYMGGVFDVRCEECRGEKIVLEVDEARLTKRQLFMWHTLQEKEAEYHRELASEREYAY